MDEKTIARFWSKVDKNGPVPAHCPELGPCWVWTGEKRKGYGRLKIDGHARTAHVEAWKQWRGPVPEGHGVLHHRRTWKHVA